MTTLPTSIEAYLNDAGFSGTEILILNKLLESDALTLRELASKSGKSTGVLDQAMKKLLVKKIVIRQSINGSLKYVLHSLKSVQEWMKSDMQQKQQLMLRKYENFEAFIATIKKGKTKPEMEFFEGREGVKRAYMELLERGKVFMQYGPTKWLPEEDPLREFHAQFLRECRKNSIFIRVITHDNVLGRRYKSRDSFEFRQTVLVEEPLHPFRFEKLIVGDTVACFQFEGEMENACFIRYNELAEEERLFFELLWNQKIEEEKKANEKRSETYGDVVDAKCAEPVKTHLLANIRRFFLGQRGLIGLSTCTVLAGFLTAGFFWQMANANLQKMREQVISVAATGALQFETADLDQLHSKADITKPEYAKVIGQLNAIRNQNPDLIYAYILRKTTEKNVYEYVADADSLHPDIVTDVNKDGKIDAADDSVIPGEKFTSVDDVLTNNIVHSPMADERPYTDQWGTFIDGTAPIYDKDGKINALLGVNKWAKDIYAGRNLQNIVGLFLLLFLVVMGVWLIAFDRFVLKEVQKYMKEQKNISAQLLAFFFTKKSLLTILSMACVAGLLTFAIYQNDTFLNLKRVQDKVVSIAATGALQFDAKDLDQLHTVADITKPEYAKTIYLLNAIRKQNDGVKYAYIMRPILGEQEMWEFVADADSLDPYAQKDLNDDGIIDEKDHLTPPGEKYNAKFAEGQRSEDAMVKPIALGPLIDQWGRLISGWAPIKNASGSTVAILGIDKFTSDVSGLTAQSFKPVYYFFIIFFVFILIRLAAFNRSLLKEIYTLAHIRKVAFIFGSAAIASVLITFGLYQYTQHITLQRMQDKVLAIASTAAPQFDYKVINALQVEQDWHKPEWNKMENQLIKIKNENKNVFYAYIFRKVKADPTKMEFVGDADSINPLANTDNDPTNDVDMNHDGKIDGSPTGGDYETWPGQPYPTVPSEGFSAYNGPTTTSNFYKDQWGIFISGYAPIKDSNGNVVAILAIDMSGASQHSLTGEAFTPIYVFIVFFALFILFRIKDFNKSLLHQLLKVLTKRIVLLTITFIITACVGFVFAVYEYTLHIMEDEIGKRLMSIAATAAPAFDATDLDQLHIAADMKKDAYQKVFKQLNDIRKYNSDIQYAYIQRITKKEGILEFVADADSNYFIPFDGKFDYNNDGILDAADQNIFPGEDYYDENAYKSAFTIPTVQGPFYDQWGMFISGYAPIRDSKGNVVAALGLDMNISDIYKSVKNVLTFNIFNP
jgi:predicted transcriptional regulator